MYLLKRTIFMTTKLLLIIFSLNRLTSKLLQLINRLMAPKGENYNFLFFIIQQKDLK